MKRSRMAACLLIAAVSVGFMSQTVFACACCAEPGTWFNREQRLSSYDLDEMSRLRFERAAMLFLTAAGYDDIRGIESPSEEYALVQSKNGSRWQFGFEDENGKRGVLSFVLPKTAEVFGVDLRDGKQGGGGGPQLYKEFRIEGSLTGSGIFKKGIKAGTRFRLVLQGRGNMCTGAEDFRSWYLEVDGKYAEFALFGNLLKPAPMKPGVNAGM